MVMWEFIEHVVTGAVILYLIIELRRVRRRLDWALLKQEFIRLDLDKDS